MNTGGDNEFWKDIPDHMLETIYGQLERSRDNNSPAPRSAEGHPTASSGASSSSSSSGMSREGSRLTVDDHDDHDLDRQSSLPPLFFPSPMISTTPFSLSEELPNDLFPTSIGGTPNPTTPSGTPGAAVFHGHTFESGPIAFVSLTAQRIKEESFTSDIELAKARGIIGQAQQLVAELQPAVQEMYAHQQQILLQKEAQEAGLVAQLQQQQGEYVSQLESCGHELGQLNTHLILSVHELHSIRSLTQRIELLKLQLSLLCNELAWKLNPAKCPANGNSVLYLEEQPLPQVIFKEKTIDESFTLRLITGSSTGLDQFGLVQAEVSSDEQQYWRTEKPLSNHQMALDPASLTVSFSKLKIHVSTRMSLVNLKFAVNFHHELFGYCQAASLIYPLIVITNESQWCDAEGKLIIYDAFGARKDIDFPLFANTLHLHFLKSTRQALDHPRRPLSARDWHYIHHRYFEGAAQVSHPQVLEFWTWFGGLVQTLRFKRHINSLWFDGLVFGIISKEQCNEELQPHELGTFLIRFSETYAGLFAVAYVSDDPFERVKHYLVKPEDTGSQKTLPDFLREKPQFQYLLKLDIEEGTLTRLAKDVALAQFYSKERILKPAGYVLL